MSIAEWGAGCMSCCEARRTARVRPRDAHSVEWAFVCSAPEEHARAALLHHLVCQLSCRGQWARPCRQRGISRHLHTRWQSRGQLPGQPWILCQQRLHKSIKAVMKTTQAAALGERHLPPCSAYAALELDVPIAAAGHHLCMWVQAGPTTTGCSCCGGGSPSKGHHLASLCSEFSFGWNAALAAASTWHTTTV